jgi:di/tricarboxylate transporter
MLPLGTAMQETGAANFLANQVMLLLGDAGPWPVIMGLYILTAMMAVAMAASASFTSPISHPANILVMGPGGYCFVDYLKVGVPLTIVVFITVMVMLPILWPLQAA